jgi:hypothetical protein
MHTPCRWPAVAAGTGMWLAVALAGGRAIPGRRVAWTSPLPDGWEALVAHVESAVGVVDGFAAHRPPSSAHIGTAVLALTRGRPAAFVRVRPAAAHRAAEAEQRALGVVCAASPRSFRTPAPLGCGVEGAWSWSLTTPLPPLAHRPAPRRLALPAATEIPGVLAGLLEDVPAGYEPAHGDFTPWNVRRMGRTTWIYDWEEVGVAPVGLDALQWRAADAVLSGRPLVDEEASPAARTWLASRIAARPDARVSGSFNERLLRVLR